MRLIQTRVIRVTRHRHTSPLALVSSYNEHVRSDFPTDPSFRATPGVDLEPFQRSPQGTPTWMHDPTQVWRVVERLQARDPHATLAWGLRFTLPEGLPSDWCKPLAIRLADELVARYGAVLHGYLAPNDAESPGRFLALATPFQTRTDHRGCSTWDFLAWRDVRGELRWIRRTAERVTAAYLNDPFDAPLPPAAGAAAAPAPPSRAAALAALAAALYAKVMANDGPDRKRSTTSPADALAVLTAVCDGWLTLPAQKFGGPGNVEDAFDGLPSGCSDVEALIRHGPCNRGASPMDFHR